jgi:cell filamentation protein
MRSDDQDINPDYLYTDPKTCILRNIENIADREALLFLEPAATAKCVIELKKYQIKVKDSRICS